MVYFWLAANLLSIIILAFYSMLEMAIVSFNKVRLQYYVSKKFKRAIWLNYLLHDPARLFGTTLIGVNVATVVGSECAREFHAAIGVDPNLAPLSQIFLVIILGELAPMFAARHYPEHVSLLGVPIIYFSSKIMKPLIWVFGKISTLTLRLIGKNQKKSNIFLSQEELMKIVEEQNEEYAHETEGDESIITTNIFRLHEKNIGMIMTPIKDVLKLPSNANVSQLKTFLNKHSVDFVPIYHHNSTNIIGIAFPRDLLRVTESKKVRDCSRAPWFIIETSGLGMILKQFRSNKKSIAVVLNKEGNTIGIITLDSLLEEIFGKGDQIKVKTYQSSLFLKDRTISGEMKVAEFNKKYKASIKSDKNASLSEIILSSLSHPPEVGDQIVIEDFEMTIKEISLRGIKTLNISSLLNN